MPLDNAPRGPAKWGWKQCWKCLTWHRPEGVIPSAGGTEYQCKDPAWCSRQAGVGRGEMKADTGEVHSQ
jgi:hypothetical protein